MADKSQQQESANPEPKGRELSQEEAKKLREGMALKEMMASEGWKIVNGWLISRAYHSWVDPKETKSQEEWLWQELNAFHSHDVAKNILQDIAEAVEVAEELEDIRLGRKQPKNLRF